jgi:hypothetical protein
VDEFSRDSNDAVVLNHLVFALVLLTCCPYETNVLAQHDVVTIMIVDSYLETDRGPNGNFVVIMDLVVVVGVVVVVVLVVVVVVVVVFVVGHVWWSCSYYSYDHCPS